MWLIDLRESILVPKVDRSVSWLCRRWSYHEPKSSDYVTAAIPDTAGPFAAVFSKREDYPPLPRFTPRISTKHQVSPSTGPQIVPQSNSLSYVAFFSRPAFALWGDGRSVVQGLFDAFRDSGVTLNDIVTVPSDTIGAQGVSVRWGDRSMVNFKFDRVEASLHNYLKRDLQALPDRISRVESWLRAAVPEQTFTSRIIDIYVHANVVGASASEVLARLGVRELDFPAVSRSHGVSYHFTYPEKHTRVDLLIDHSFVVQAGIYLHFGIIVDGDVVAYDELIRWSEETMRAMLAATGLTFVEEL